MTTENPLSAFEGLPLGAKPGALGPLGYTPEDWMRIALKEAQKAYDAEEVPVGAIIVGPGAEILAKAYNQRELLKDPTAHAEMIALTQAAQALGSWRLNECTMYVTLEPCPMCAGALVNARLGGLVYGAVDPKAGACESLYRIANDSRLNHRIPTRSGILGGACGEILRAFFRARRKGS
ncbi:MAG: tRNA adenosine(34) deaminase TadA [Planctomycetota bacterium]|jgi:tRNA(adenine34) deaminase